MKKVPLIKLLLSTGLVESEEKARALVLAAKVRVAGVPVTQAGQPVDENSDIQIEQQSQYVGRGAEKLLAALHHFDVIIDGKVCADIGSSTGGFTDVLLQSGARQVYAVDSAYGELDWKLRSDDRVVVMERTNALTIEGFEHEVELLCVDVSLLSIQKLLPSLQRAVSKDSDWIVLLKPQYEATREQLPPGAVITDPGTHREIVESVTRELENSGFYLQAIIASPILGGKGNKEFLLHLYQGESEPGKRTKILEDFFKAAES